jgi:hypothetical protein
MWGRKKRFPFEIRPILKCQRLTAKELLARRYGIRPSEGPSEWVDLEWQVWLSVLWKPLPVSRQAVLTVRTLLGCGLAAFSALYISPVLRNRYFIVFAVTFVASGCFQLVEVSRWRYEPMRNSLSRLASMLTELAEVNAATRKDHDGSEGGASLTLSADTKEDGLSHDGP